MIKLSIAALALSAFSIAPAFAETVSNTAAISIPDEGQAISTISVANIAGNITGLTLTLNGLSHTFPDDLVFGLLNVDSGLGFIFMSSAGSNKKIKNVTLTFSDLASGTLPETSGGKPIVSGTYLPSDFFSPDFDDFDDVTSFAGYNGLSANGAWRLYLNDLYQGDTGSLSGGWSLDFTTDAIVPGAVPEPASWALMLGGFGAIGGAMRSRRKTAVSFG